MLNPKFIEKVHELAERENITPEDMLGQALTWWINKHICPGLNVTAFQDLYWFENIESIPLEINGDWDNSEESDSIVRFEIMSFADFWKRYDFPRGSKKSARSKFKGLKRKDLVGIDQTLHIYKAETWTFSEIKGKRQRKQAEFYLSAKLWEATQEIYNRVAGEPVEQNLQSIFGLLKVDMPYMIAPSAEDLRSALDYFITTVPSYNPNTLIDALQEFYDDKGQYAGKIASILRSIDFRPYYTNRLNA